MKSGIYFLVPRAQLDQRTAREVIDALRYERAYPVSKPPTGYYMFQKIDADAGTPAIRRWQALGVTIALYDDDPEVLRGAARPDAPPASSAPDTFDLIGVLQGLMEACDVGNQTPKQKAAFDRAAEALNAFQRVGIKVFNN